MLNRTPALLQKFDLFTMQLSENLLDRVRRCVTSLSQRISSKGFYFCEGVRNYVRGELGLENLRGLTLNFRQETEHGDIH